jgi:ABC-type nickel/cobalt efflux system permease component RcnA
MHLIQIGLFVSAFTIIIVYELYFIIVTVIAIWKWLRTWWRARKGDKHASDADDERDTGESTTTDLRREGSARGHQHDSDSNSHAESSQVHPQPH